MAGGQASLPDCCPTGYVSSYLARWPSCMTDGLKDDNPSIPHDDMWAGWKDAMPARLQRIQPSCQQAGMLSVYLAVLHELLQA